MKRTLKRTENPRRAAAPIQYQFFSGKTLKVSSTATPKLVELSLPCIEENSKHILRIAKNEKRKIKQSKEVIIVQKVKSLPVCSSILEQTFHSQSWH